MPLTNSKLCYSPQRVIMCVHVRVRVLVCVRACVCVRAWVRVPACVCACACVCVCWCSVYNERTRLAAISFARHGSTVLRPHTNISFVLFSHSVAQSCGQSRHQLVVPLGSRACPWERNSLSALPGTSSVGRLILESPESIYLPPQKYSDAWRASDLMSV